MAPSTSGTRFDTGCRALTTVLDWLCGERSAPSPTARTEYVTRTPLPTSEST